MAVLQMRKINICAMKKNRKKILEFCKKKGVWKFRKQTMKTLYL